MDKIKKKEFKMLHKHGLLWLVQGGIKNKTLNEISNAIDHIQPDFKFIETSNIDISNHSDYLKVSVYRYKDFFIVQDIVDNSKNPNCSWNTIEKYSTVYKLK